MVCAAPAVVATGALSRQLSDALTRADAQRTRSFSVDDYLADLQANATPAQQMVLPSTPSEGAFLDMLIDRGQIESQLLTTDDRLRARITAEPWLQWKALNVRTHVAAQALSSEPADSRAPGRHDQEGPVAVGVQVRRYQLDNQGWEVAMTEPDSIPRPLSGPHPTLAKAEEARDFLVRLVNVQKLHILDEGPEPSDRPTVAVFNHSPNEPWYLLCLNADGTVDDKSPPYPSNRAAAAVLDQFRSLIETTADYDIGRRATPEPTSNTCRCSQAGWRCDHVEI